MPLETESSKSTLIVMLVTDVTLLLIMLIGLLRLRHHLSNMFGLTRLLWRQVYRFSLAVFVLSTETCPFIRDSFGC